jgi:hypothetical protein
MNTLKTVFGKLFKEETTNLASHEVELGAIQDLEKLILSAQKDLDAFNKSSKELKSLAKLVVANGDSFRTYTKGIGDLGTVLEKQFKELGLNYLENPTVKKAVAMIRNDFDVRSFTDSARQLTK